MEAESSKLFPEPEKLPDWWDHQLETIEKASSLNCFYDMSDPGTGKTRVWIEVIKRKLSEEAPEGKRNCALVLAPKSILKPAWGNDIEKYSGGMTYSIAQASNRDKAFNEDVDIYITNHDGIKWMADKRNRHFWDKADRNWKVITIDEMTAFKHATSLRSKALLKMAKMFENRFAMSGTPNPNGMLDLWHQIMVLDEGKRLGDSFYRFRNVVCEPKQVGPQPNMVKWEDKPGSAEAVADLIEDITIRHVFEECVNIPPNHAYFERFDLTPKHQKAYDTLKEHAVIEYENGNVTAFNAGTLANKLLQMSSGAVYTANNDETGQRVSETFSTTRYELVMDLVEARKQCVVAFVWKHQREALAKLADSRGISYAVLDGTVTSSNKRAEIVQQYQAGLIKVLFIHPKTGSHGLTLTAGTTTIWASPIYDAELFTQFNSRIYRGGQTKKTETIMVCANGTIDEEVYERLRTKLDRMSDLLEMITDE